MDLGRAEYDHNTLENSLKEILKMRGERNYGVDGSCRAWVSNTAAFSSTAGFGPQGWEHGPSEEVCHCCSSGRPLLGLSLL